ncbi:MAG: glycosyltransferase family 39 protein [Steroidobacteraceae bacterium]
MGPAALRSRPRAGYSLRFDVSTALGPLTDVVVFIAATGGGVRLGAAHIISFAAAAVVNYLLNVHAVVAAGRTRDMRLHGHLIAVTVFALFLRGGVLALLTTVWGWPAQVAIVFAVLATMAVIRPGYAFSLVSSTWNIGSGARWRVLAAALIGCAFLLRLIYLAQVELLPEEAYYWNYSQHLDIGYLDHPPMVAWLIRLGTFACGDTAFGVRIGALGSAVVASFFAYRLTRNLFGEPSALVALVLMQILPFFFVAGMLMTPDAPLTAAWAATLYFLERALVGGRAAAWWRAGLCLGIGLVSKYTIGLLVPAAAVFALVDSSARRWLLRWQPYGAVALALAVFSPVIIWNARHEWASFAFQTARRLADTPQFALHKLVASALVLLMPTGLLTLAVASFGRNPVDAAADQLADARRRWRFVYVGVLVPLAVFVVFSLRHEVKLDWTGALWVAAVPALARCIVSWGEPAIMGLRRWIHGAWVPTAVFLLLIYGAGLHYLVLGLPGVGYSKHVEVVPVAWRDFGRRINQTVAAIRAQTGSEPLIVGMDRYVIASELAFYARNGRQSVRETSSRQLFGLDGLMYEQWFPPGQQAGRTLLLVGWNPEDVSAAPIESRVTRLEPVQEGELVRDGIFIRHYYYRVAYGYR